MAAGPPPSKIAQVIAWLRRVGTQIVAGTIWLIRTIWRGVVWFGIQSWKFLTKHAKTIAGVIAVLSGIAAILAVIIQLNQLSNDNFARQTASALQQSELSSRLTREAAQDQSQATANAEERAARATENAEGHTNRTADTAQFQTQFAQQALGNEILSTMVGIALQERDVQSEIATQQVQASTPGPTGEAAAERVEELTATLIVLATQGSQAEARATSVATKLPRTRTPQHSTLTPSPKNLEVPTNTNTATPSNVAAPAAANTLIPPTIQPANASPRQQPTTTPLPTPTRALPPTEDVTIGPSPTRAVPPSEEATSEPSPTRAVPPGDNSSDESEPTRAVPPNT